MVLLIIYHITTELNEAIRNSLIKYLSLPLLSLPLIGRDKLAFPIQLLLFVQQQLFFATLANFLTTFDFLAQVSVAFLVDLITRIRK